MAKNRGFKKMTYKELKTAKDETKRMIIQEKIAKIESIARDIQEEYTYKT